MKMKNLQSEPLNITRDAKTINQQSAEKSSDSTVEAKYLKMELDIFDYTLNYFYIVQHP